MKVIDFLRSTFHPTNYIVRPRVKCADGFSISIQGSTYGHYCSPKGEYKFFNGKFVNKNVNEYEKVELGFPDYGKFCRFIRKYLYWLKPYNDKFIGEYAEDPSIPEGTVYGYVPLDVVEKLIAHHGGIVAIQNRQNPEKWDKI